ncbi:MAG: alkaline phosphatase D family protein [Solirubrobacteraceae bacterium]|nr:alkaline phosphatase D family protein [Solirubrobacteraceae bacterium]
MSSRARRALRYGAGLALATLMLLLLGRLIEATALLEADKEAFDLLYDAAGSPAVLDELVVDPPFGNYVLLTLIVAFATAGRHVGRPLRAIAVMVGAALVAYAMVRFTWALWERPRPEEVLGIPPAHGHRLDGYPSFPSAHMAVTTALVAMGAMLVPVLRFPLWGYALLVAATRVSYGGHFPSDVAAALVLGYLAAHATLAVADDAPSRIRPALRALVSSPEGSRRLRRIAQALSVAALAVFLVLVVSVGPPHSPDGGVIGSANEQYLQLGLLALAAVGVAAGWYHDALASGLLAVNGMCLGVLAALEYNPAFAVAACLSFFLPAILFALAWHPVHTLRGAAVAGMLTGGLLGLGAVAALAVHDRAYGPKHPESALATPPTWRVVWAWSGNVTSDRATVNAHLNADGRVRLLVSRRADLADARVFGPRRADDDRNERLVSFTARGLTPATRYFYGLEFDGRIDRNRIGRFATFAAGRQSFKLAIGGCARVGSNGAVFDAIRRERADLYLALGDLFYANIEQNSRGRFVEHYDSAVASPAQGALYRSSPIAYVWDDHDYGPNGADGSSPSREAARWSYGAAVPHYALPAGRAGPIHQAFTIGRVRFLVLDTRSARTARSVLGGEQMRWLQRELIAARDRFALTVLVSSVPWIGRAGAADDDSWAGHPAERAALSRFIARQRIRRLVMLAGDAHMVAIDDGSHSDYSGTGRAGFPVFHAAALDRAGSVKGGPYSEGAVPGAGHYGTMTVTDHGDRVDVGLSGRDYRDRELVGHAFAVDARTIP